MYLILFPSIPYDLHQPFQISEYFVTTCSTSRANINRRVSEGNWLTYLEYQAIFGRNGAALRGSCRATIGWIHALGNVFYTNEHLNSLVQFLRYESGNNPDLAVLRCT